MKNSKGSIWYGMHFYPGLAEYQEDPSKPPSRVFLNEDTIRTMDPTFAGCPVFVEHVDDVEQNINKLRNEADGWVIESFYNAADGKHWVKFVVVSEDGEKAIRQGLRLSNCYVPQLSSQGGIWNGLSFQKQVLGGTYEHLALVKHPRYDESVVMTPDEFKKYNETKLVELNRLKNSKGESKMKGLSFFKRTKVENDLEQMSVILPSSGKEVTLLELIKNADSAPPPPPKTEHKLDPAGVASISKAFGNEEDKKEEDKPMADLSHKVKLHDGSMMNVAELVEKHKAMYDAMMSEGDGKEDQDKEYEEAPAIGNAEGKDMPKGDSESDVAGGEKKKNAKEAAEKLRNARPIAKVEPKQIVLSMDKVAIGKARYGSGK